MKIAQRGLRGKVKYLLARCCLDAEKVERLVLAGRCVSLRELRSKILKRRTKKGSQKFLDILHEEYASAAKKQSRPMICKGVLPVLAAAAQRLLKDEAYSRKALECLRSWINHMIADREEELDLGYHKQELITLVPASSSGEFLGLMTDVAIARLQNPKPMETPALLAMVEPIITYVSLQRRVAWWRAFEPRLRQAYESIRGHDETVAFLEALKVRMKTNHTNETSKALSSWIVETHQKWLKKGCYLIKKEGSPLASVIPLDRNVA